MTNRGIDVIQNDFTQLFYRRLVDTLVRTILEDFDVLVQRKLFLLIFFLVLLLLAYVIVWLPLVNNLNNQIYKTKLMLMIVPLEILMRLKSVDKVL